MIKITSTIRRMASDREFFDAIAMLIQAQDKLREMEMLRRGPSRQQRLSDFAIADDGAINLKKGLRHV